MASKIRKIHEGDTKTVSDLQKTYSNSRMFPV